MHVHIAKAGKYRVMTENGRSARKSKRNKRAYPRKQVVGKTNLCHSLTSLHGIRTRRVLPQRLEGCRNRVLLASLLYHIACLSVKKQSPVCRTFVKSVILFTLSIQKAGHFAMCLIICFQPQKNKTDQLFSQNPYGKTITIEKTDPAVRDGRSLFRISPVPE